ncbi:MAG: bifunctional 5,10-methylenetetrahydrofolate dehydrogenase/5,10-methenyltetrahydrofolate cyclohydrolase [Tissierellia bacterium]|nr:bifunctional 5,10-methylenetetrahydrofolate dehydrogenase/5,10-methenyltetrahydrofolate cyclohydrolase [Tissierellia bacterium]
MQILNCNELFNQNIDYIKKLLDIYDNKPTLATIRVGNDEGSISYEKTLEKLSEKLGLGFRKSIFDNGIGQEDIIDRLKELNNDKAVKGILVFKPLPKNFDENVILNNIDHNKDIDGASSKSLKKILGYENYHNLPATAVAIENYLDTITELEGKNVLIINRSNTIGIPLWHLLTNKNATCTVAHSRTKDVEKMMETVDIIVSGVGRSEIFNPKVLKENAIVIDMGISCDLEGKYTGDFNRKNIEQMNISYMPSINGIGKLTRSIIIKNTCFNMEEI